MMTSYTSKITTEPVNSADYAGEESGVKTDK